jgi:hypothetical protein
MDDLISRGVDSLKKRITEINSATKDTENMIRELRKNLEEKQLRLQKELAVLHEQQLVLDHAFRELKVSLDDNANFGLSVILTAEDKRVLTKLCAFPYNTKWNLIYRATADGFFAKNFHSKCDKSKGLIDFLLVSREIL